MPEMAATKLTTATTAVLTMKLLVDTKSRRVLYAEAGKEVVDFLFSVLSLPLGAVTKLLTTAGMVGAVGKLYGSVQTLDAGYYVCRRDAKDALLEPHVVHQFVAAVPPPTAAPGDDGLLYRCKGCSCSPGCYGYATKVRGTPCPACKGEMTTVVQLVEPDRDASGGGSSKVMAAAPPVEQGSGNGFVRDLVTYTVMDDLSVSPNSTITAVTSIVALGITDISGLKSMTVEIGHKEGLKILRASLQSKTVLTDVFLGAKQDASS